MTLEESCQMWSNFSHLTNPLSPDYMRLLSAINLSPISGSTLAGLYSQINHSPVIANLGISEFSPQLPSQILSPYLNAYISPIDTSLLNSITTVITNSTPYLDSNIKEKCINAIPLSLKDDPKRRLTLSDALSILSILLMIFFEITSSRPDGQLERIIAQNDISIAQNDILIAQNSTIIEQQAEIMENDKALYDTLNSLTDTINRVSETIKLFCEESESFQDELEDVKGSSHCPCQTNSGDSHQQDCDTKENADSLQSFDPSLRWSDSSEFEFLSNIFFTSRRLKGVDIRKHEKTK